MNRPTRLRPAARTLEAILLLLALGADPSSAQERLGAAVAVTGPDEVAVLKPGALRGPAATLLFRADAEGRWRRTDRLQALPGAFPGETLTPTLVAARPASGGRLLLLGGGDPDGDLAGHLWARGAEGWSAVGRISVDGALRRGSAEDGGLGEGGLDMGTLMRLMEPPARTVAVSTDGRRMAVAGGGVEPGAVHLLRREGSAGDGLWALEAVLRAGDPAAGGGMAGTDGDRPGTGAGSDAPPEGFGAALAVGDGRVLVGAPEAGPGGAAWLFEVVGDRWAPVARLVSDSTEAEGRLGAAVALAADEALIGAPGRDRVVRLVRGADGSWARAGELRPATGSAGGPEGLGFGAALALDGARLLVGAPGAGGGRGAVHRRVRRNGAWEAERPVASPEGQPGDGFGAAVALAEGRAVVGAPGADGGRGRAAVFDPAAAAPEVAWLDPELELERVAGGEVRCREGEAAGFACEGVDLLSFLPLSAMGAGPAEQVSDTWGWSDPETGREYALVGRTAGLAFVDVTDPASPRFVGLMPANPSGARDIKVYRDHAFLTGDGAGEHGLLVFDLTRLRDGGEGGAGAGGAAGTAEARSGGGLLFEPDARYERVASAHNLVIDTESGFAYTVGTNTGGESCGGGLHMIDIRDPLSPTFAGCYTDTEGLIWSGRTHDAQCTVYRGPDEAYRGRQLCFAANETALRIVDVTDKSAPEAIARASHPGTAYVHQGWLTEDHRYFLVNDELDEIVGTTDRTRTLVWDVAELDDPILVAEHLGPDQATDHNLYIRGGRAYLANYQAGMRVLDISDPENPVEIGWFDTTPYEGNPPGFLGGAWTAYPFLESGTVVVTSMNEGLFLLRPRPEVLP